MGVPELWLGRRGKRWHRRMKHAEAAGGQKGVDVESDLLDAFGGQRSIQLSYGSSDGEDHSVRICDAQCLGGKCFAPLVCRIRRKHLNAEVVHSNRVGSVSTGQQRGEPESRDVGGLWIAQERHG